MKQALAEIRWIPTKQDIIHCAVVGIPAGLFFSGLLHLLDWMF